MTTSDKANAALRHLGEYVGALAEEGRWCVEQIQRLQQDKATLSRDIKRLNTRLDQANELITTQRDSLRDMRGLVDKLRDLVVSERREPGLDQGHVAHFELARQVRKLARPTMDNLARLALKARGSPPPGPNAARELARMVRELMVVCLGDGSVDRAALLAVLGDDRSGAVADKADQAFEIARELRKALDATGHPVVFLFDHPFGAPDLDHVDLWDDTCDSDDPVAFVVVPGYRVDRHEIGRPVVYTVPPGHAEHAP